MSRRLLFGSYALFGLLLIDLLWGSKWLPRSVEIPAIVSTAIVWVFSLHILFQQLGLSVRGKFIAWFIVATFIACHVIHEFASYYLFHNYWSRWIAIDVVGILVFFSSMGLLVLLLRTPSDSSAVAPYTVESEAPDHVFHVENTPN
jgi:hypothetical protein